MRDPISLRIEEPSQAGEARRIAAEMARVLGFNETERGSVALAVTEAANNLHHHARGGQLILRSLERDGTSGLSMLCLDRGPGIADLAASLRDGYSSAGTAGKGLGAIRRLSSTFDLYSTEAGTVLAAEFWPRGGGGVRAPEGGLGEAPSTHLDVGAVCLPLAGEEVCGDSWAVFSTPQRYLLFVADGLGHGAAAADAAREAVRLFQSAAGRNPGQVLEALHAGLRGTRGAAAAVAELDPVARQIRYAGVGNIAASLWHGAGTQSLVSQNGTLGHQVRKIQEFVYPWPAGSTLILCSDGVGTSWRLDRYPGLASRCPEIIAGVLYRDFARARDDATVVVARESEAGT
jgi:anti-sigma regulatory factor (Ser/Thr protein kinase)